MGNFLLGSGGGRFLGTTSVLGRGYESTNCLTLIDHLYQEINLFPISWDTDF